MFLIFGFCRRREAVFLDMNNYHRIRKGGKGVCGRLGLVVVLV